MGATVCAGLDEAAFVLNILGFEAVFPCGLSVPPLFVFMGKFATRAGLSASLCEAANAFVGHGCGGRCRLGASAGFGAICGSSLVTTATIGGWLPEMRRHGYAESLAAGSAAAGGTRPFSPPRECQVFCV